MFARILPVIAAAGLVAYSVYKGRRVARLVRKLEDFYPSQPNHEEFLERIQQLQRWQAHGRVSAEEAREVTRILRNKLGVDVVDGIQGLQSLQEPAAGFEEQEDENTPRPSVRRGRRWNAAYEIYVRCVAELGTKPYSPAMKDVVMNVARRQMKTMNVRYVDYPRLLPLVTTMYFTPNAEEVMCAAVMQSDAHKALRALVDGNK